MDVVTNATKSQFKKCESDVKPSFETPLIIKDQAILHRDKQLMGGLRDAARSHVPRTTCQFKT